MSDLGALRLPGVPHGPGAGDDRSRRGPDDGWTGGRETAAGPAATARHLPADPVKALMARHRALCESAVDPLEIAAVLEAHGITDRAAARFRHRNVFSLAEELYARTPRHGDTRAGTSPRGGPHTGTSRSRNAYAGASPYGDTPGGTPHVRAAQAGSPGAGERRGGTRYADGTPAGAPHGGPTAAGSTYPGGTGAGRPYPEGAGAGRPYAGGARARAPREGGVRVRTPRERDPYGSHPRHGGPGDTAPAAPPVPRAVRVARVGLTLLPGALCAGAVAGLRLTQGQPRPAVAVAVSGALAVVWAAHAAVRRGPLRVPGRRRSTGLWTWWLMGHALLGEGLLRAALAGGPDGLPTGGTAGPWPVTTAPFLALTLACAPAAGTARLFARGVRRRLTASRGPDDFTAATRPLLLGAVALFLAVLAALLTATGSGLGEPPAYPQALTLGALLLLARLLAVHGSTRAPAFALSATSLAQATALALVFAARLPGCEALGAPVETLITAGGPAVIPAATCGIGALALLLHAMRRLTRASAHFRTERAC